MVEILFMFSFGVAHPYEPFAKGKQTQIWQSKYRSTLLPENELRLLSILDTVMD